MNTADRVLAYVCALVAVFVLAYVAGQVVSPEHQAPAPADHPGMTP